MTARRCPHARIQFCPLYVAAHVPNGGGCDDGHIHDGRCAVDRGMDYGCELARIRGKDPRLVAMLAFNEDAAIATAQRARNRQQNGVQ